MTISSAAMRGKNVLLSAATAACLAFAMNANAQVEEPVGSATSAEQSTTRDPGQTPPVSPRSTQGSAPESEPSTTSEQLDSAAANTAATAPLEDKKIEQFANAYLAVQTIQQKAVKELETASDPAQADKVKSDAESAMIAAVERSGLRVDEFNSIVESMAADVNVRSRIAAELQERSNGT